MTCSVDGCDRPAHGRGWCKLHYGRHRAAGTLEDSPSLQRAAPPGHVGTENACEATGLSFRQLDYWDRTGLFPAAIPASGSGSRRYYSDAQVARLHVVAARIEWGLTPDAAVRPTDPPLPTFALAGAS